MSTPSAQTNPAHLKSRNTLTMIVNNLRLGGLIFSKHTPNGPCTHLHPDAYEEYVASLWCSERDTSYIVYTWENLLQRFPCPYLLLLVGDIYACGGQFTGALALYRELQSCIGLGADQVFDAFLTDFQSRCLKREQKHIDMWALGTDKEEWRSWTPFTSAGGTGQPEEDSLRGRWSQLRLDNVQHSMPTSVVQRYFRLLCVDTNLLESVFSICSQSGENLVRTGFFASAISSFSLGSRMGDRREVIDVLRDTHEALRMVYMVSGSRPIRIDTPWLCQLHTLLLKSCHVSVSLTGELNQYIAPGVLRSSTKTNVAIRKKPRTLVQFCPFDQVAEQLKGILLHLERLLIDHADKPFLIASWIHTEFIVCHPFEDGNGRVARLLASIPLTMAGFPPLSVPAHMKEQYFEVLTEARTRGALGSLAKFMTVCVQSSIDRAQALVPSNAEDEAIMDAVEFRLFPGDEFPTDAVTDVAPIDF
ncbi:hypothetical protein FA95DRAFT_682831 [Auriscalpium vulgare]|uniref:Uncharacterized protein n=1 Tax=Auriscalpium vulgare TaxID=40419 RepID=A0ACB8S254_9AGAM|nr:hypothetical protein FA95DRAFT_682831 [Auriscalpium vulgare]